MVEGLKVSVQGKEGYLLEITGGEERDEMLDYVRALQKTDIAHVYSCRHAENDMSFPCTVENKNILVNRFGFLITESELDFRGDDFIDVTGGDDKMDVITDDGKLIKVDVTELYNVPYGGGKYTDTYKYNGNGWVHVSTLRKCTK